MSDREEKSLYFCSHLTASHNSSLKQVMPADYLPEDYEHHMWLRETAYMVDQLTVSKSLEAASTLMAVTPGSFLHYLAFPTYITCQCHNWTSLPTG